MAGTVYPYSYQDMPIRDIRRLYLSHDRTTAVHPLFHAGVSAKPYRQPQDRPLSTRLNAEAHLMMSPRTGKMHSA